MRKLIAAAVAPLRATERAGAAIALAGAALLSGGAQAAPRQKAPPALPEGAVVTNLRSVTGRTIYLLLRPEPAAVSGLRERAEQVAVAASAKLRLRPAGALWVAVLEHPSQGLDVHRHGRDLRIYQGPPGSLDEALSAGVRLRAERPDSDLDQEILLKARSVMRDREDVPQRLVALAQAAAARQVLLRYVAGDDVGAALWGRRYLPLLMQHPDAKLLKELVAFSWEGLTVSPPAEPPHVALAGPAPAHAPAAWDGTFAAAVATAEHARRFLREPPPTADKGEGEPAGKGGHRERTSRSERASKAGKEARDRAAKGGAEAAAGKDEGGADRGKDEAPSGAAPAKAKAKEAVTGADARPAGKGDAGSSAATGDKAEEKGQEASR